MTALVNMLRCHCVKTRTRCVQLEAHHMLALGRFSLLQSASSRDLDVGCGCRSFPLLEPT